MKNLVIGIAAAPAMVLAGAATSAQAADDRRAPSRAEEGLYVRAAIGAAFGHKFDQDLTFENVAVAMPSPESQAVKTNAGVIVGGAVGYKYPSGFRTELEYRYASTGVKEARVAGPGIDLSINPPDDVQAHVLMSNVLYDFDNDTRFTPYLGVGVGGVRVRSSVSLGQDTAADTAFAYQAKAGVAVDVRPSLKVGAEYTYTRSRDLEFKTDLGGGGQLLTNGAPFVQSAVMLTLVKAF